MSERKLLGMLTSSSNTALEPICAAMLSELPEVSAHFARVRATATSPTQGAIGQTEHQPMLQAALLLADARVDAICWSGTSAGWLGFRGDRSLCKAIHESTGIPATTAVLALGQIFRAARVRRFAMVSPYLDEVQQTVITSFAEEGFQCVAERHLSIRNSFAFSEVTAGALTGMVHSVASSKPDAIMIFSTNLHGAPLVERLEQEVGIPVYDSTAAAVWGALRMAGVSPSAVQGWGRVFRELS